MVFRPPVAGHFGENPANPSRYRAVVFDLDGTIYLDGVPIDGASDAVAAVRESGRATLFVSNNPLRTPREYAERLTRIGIGTSETEVLTSGTVVTEWLRAELPGAVVFVVGEPAFCEQLRHAGIAVTSVWREADVVLASFDRTFSYDHWRDACHALRAGARFVATNPDVTCPTTEGEIPDCGGVIAALEASSGRQVEIVAGKPSAVMSSRIRRELAIPSSDILVVGDRLATDIAMAHHAGFDSVLVLSGVTSRGDIESTAWQPSHVLNSVGGLPHLLGLAEVSST